MLVLVGNLRLTDGTCGPSTAPDAVELLADRLADLALRASWRSDGSFRPIERIDLALVGDTCDLIHSSQWLDHADHLLKSPESAAAAEQVGAIVERILTHNTRAAALLKAVFADGALRIPMADSASHLSANHWQPVEVRAWMMVGSHDWPLALEGSAYHAVRGKLVSRLGLANRPEIPFPHDPPGQDELHEALRRRRTLVRPGDVFDPLAYGGVRGAAGAANILSIELICRFLAALRAEVADELNPTAQAALAELPNVWPSALAAAWLGSCLERAGVSSPVRCAIKRRWDSLAESALAHSSLRMALPHPSANSLDGLADALLFSRRPASGWIGRTQGWLRSLYSHDSLRQHALAEPDFRNRRARHIVYGHSRAAECVPLEASFAEGFVLHQTYFNVGAWSRAWTATQWACGDGEMAPSDTLSLLAIYEGDERGGRPYELWSGTLGTPMLDSSPPKARAAAASALPRGAHGPHEAPSRHPHYPAAIGVPRPFSTFRS